MVNNQLNKLPDFIHKKMKTRRAEPDTSLMTNGWMLINEGIGTYGVDYFRRAYIDFIGLGACIPEDAVYPNCTRDINGDPLNAKTEYRIHFNADQLPPVNAFWSLTAYNADEFLVKNDLNRFALGDRDELKYNEDGSLDLYIQSTAPEAEYLQNWLPIPQDGTFYLTMRLYWPKEEVLNGDWNIPFVVPVRNTDIPVCTSHGTDKNVCFTFTTISMINLISDTVTHPTHAMREAMMNAPVGDDVFKADPTVNALQEKAARMFGKDAALFCPSGTMCNQIAISVHTRPMDEVICEKLSHVYQSENGGYAFNSWAGSRLPSIRLMIGCRIAAWWSWRIAAILAGVQCIIWRK